MIRDSAHGLKGDAKSATQLLTTGETMEELTVATIRECWRQLKAVPQHSLTFNINPEPVPHITRWRLWAYRRLKNRKLAAHVRLTIDNVVIFDGGMMHIQTFRDLMGEKLYRELLARPRVPSPYGDA